MKHRHSGRVFGRVRRIRVALFKTLLGSLVLHEKMTTTEAKAKEIKMLIDPFINKARDARSETAGPGRKLSLTRQLHERLPKMTAEKLLSEFVDRFGDRRSGYTRVVKLEARKSDGARMAVIEFV